MKLPGHANISNKKIHEIYFWKILRFFKNISKNHELLRYFEIFSAKKLNRRYIASEIDKDRFELSEERLKTLDYSMDKFLEN